MSRRMPSSNIQPQLIQKYIEENDQETWTQYHGELATPMYGGGVTAGQVDAEMPIRPSAIRGQLRFWWRIANGYHSKSSKELFQLESDIWGGIGAKEAKKSKIAIRVSALSGTHHLIALSSYQNENKKTATAKQHRKNESKCEDAIQYGLFSGQDALNKDKAPTNLLKETYKFKIEIQLNSSLSSEKRLEIEKSLNNALRWWNSFGGLGARTRRGFGAIRLRHNDKDLEPVTLAEVEACHGKLVLIPNDNSDTALYVWNKAIKALKDFRQSPYSRARNPGEATNRPGRSLWSEADTIRHLSGKSSPRHRKRIVSVNAFPRAAFGLPIVFHFKDEKDGEPNDHYLEPADIGNTSDGTGKRERMASPLILRPYWNGKAWQAAALLLPGWEKACSVGLKFKDKTYTPPQWPKSLEQREQYSANIKPMTHRDGTLRGTDPLTAFLDYFKENA